ncbi:ATP-binding protein [Chlorobium sp. KB01]|uniref:ATP-binding protein n=1 Tax=Chlorobium sp. KB01 TaxID=1917528 RepID=UPI00097846DD|nr:ATP-binding protein [Chlorobium sp. KB01]
MHFTELQKSIVAGESLKLELKKSTAEKDRACRTLCVLANGQGGQVVFGVIPSGKIVGQKVTDRTLEELSQEFQGFEPPLSLQLERIPLSEGNEQGLEVLLVAVERATSAPVSFRGIPYERVLNTTRVMHRANYQRLLVESMHTTERWEIQPAVGCCEADLDIHEIIVTLEESIRRGRSVDPGTREPLAVLRGLGLLVNGEQLSRAAIALFCKDEVALPEFPQFNLRVARFKGTTRDEFLDNRQYTGNAFTLMRRAERFMIDWLPVASKIVSGQMVRIDMPALPPEAVREALANAFIHRDYTSAAGSVAVALYDDRLEIISPGELHFGLTPEILYQPHESKPWNPWIAKVFYRRGLIKTWGRGTLRIASLMQSAGLPVPILHENAGSVVMTFKLPEQRSGVNVGVNVGVNALFAYIQANPGHRAGEMAASFKVTQRTIERWLKQLREAGKIEYMGSPKTGGYYPKQ